MAMYGQAASGPNYQAAGPEAEASMFRVCNQSAGPDKRSASGGENAKRRRPKFASPNSRHWRGASATEAIQFFAVSLGDCFASLAMTVLVTARRRMRCDGRHAPHGYRRQSSATKQRALLCLVWTPNRPSLPLRPLSL